MSFATFTNRSAIGLIVSFATIVAARTSVAQSGYGYLSAPARSYSPPLVCGSYHASTAAEGYLRGRAAVIDSLGNFEVNDGQAEILREQGRALNRENNLKQTEALQSQLKMWSD